MCHRAMNPVVRGDIVVEHFLNSVGGYRHKERRDRLLDILDVDLDWHMHAISDGERRRVQLCMGLMQSWDVLLLDEVRYLHVACVNVDIGFTNFAAQVTVDLDVQVRYDLLSFLKEDSERRGATILCKVSDILTARKLILAGPLDATHIFDGLNEFPTHIAHMRLGTFVKKPRPWSRVLAGQSLDNIAGGLDRTLFEIALEWLREDREHRRELEKAGRKTRGARRDQVRTLFLCDLGCGANAYELRTFHRAPKRFIESTWTGVSVWCARFDKCSRYDYSH